LKHPGSTYTISSKGVEKVKRTFFYTALIITVILVAGCPMNPSMFDADDFEVGASAAIFTLPDDVSSDTVRSRAAVFEFKTLLPVDVVIAVDLYGTDGPGDDDIIKLDPSMADVFLRMHDEEGNTVFQGLVGDDGVLSTVVYLPAAQEDITLSLEAAGFDGRELRVKNMVSYEKIVRTLSMLQSRALITARSIQEDADGDGVPDGEDVSPKDPNEAYAIRIPAEGNLSVAFEDLFGHADAGDADYNDFIAAYNITEYVDSSATLVSRIEFDVTAKEKIAGYNHLFGIRMDSFTGEASVSGKFINYWGYEVPYYRSGIDAPLEIPVFKNTSKALGKNVKFTVKFKTPQNIDGNAGEVIVDRAPFNPYLFVWDTGKDIHLVGEETIKDSENPGAVYLDGNNFPWGLLVPVDWDPPAEGERIENYYPDFTAWRESGGVSNEDWYENYVDPNAPAPDVYPYPVTGPGEASFEQGIGAVQTVTLQTDAPAEDNVTFHSSTLPLLYYSNEYATLDPDTGVISVIAAPYTGQQYDEEITVWVEDANGLKSEEFVITLHFVAGS